MDAPLPANADGTGRTTFCVEDVYAELHDRRGLPVRKDQFFCPNVDLQIVRELVRLGFIHAVHLCVCLFLQYYASFIRDRYGGQRAITDCSLRPDSS